MKKIFITAVETGLNIELYFLAGKLTLEVLSVAPMQIFHFSPGNFSQSSLLYQGINFIKYLIQLFYFLLFYLSYFIFIYFISRLTYLFLFHLFPAFLFFTYFFSVYFIFKWFVFCLFCIYFSNLFFMLDFNILFDS